MPNLTIIIVQGTIMDHYATGWCVSCSSESVEANLTVYFEFKMSGMHLFLTVLETWNLCVVEAVHCAAENKRITSIPIKYITASTMI